MTSPPADNPRAFVHATGLVYQVVGFVLALGTCCWWSFADHGGPELIQMQGARRVNVLDETPPAARTWAMLATCVSLIGGLALTALGIGFQHELSRSGRPAKWTTGAIAAFFAAYLIMAAMGFPAWGRIITATGMLALWTVMFLLAGVSAETLRAHPPPSRNSSWSSRDEDDLRSTSSHQRPGGTNP
ncbi:MAG TPA: hypothetical protein VMV81_14065 [Phycisphaerae bacterium]|nr:hypothetical protein [Phycisphaerae bacterium]